MVTDASFIKSEKSMPETEESSTGQFSEATHWILR